MIYDILIVGAGPCGLAVAVEAKVKGLKTIVLEKGSIADSIRRYPQQMTFFSTAENIAIGDVPFLINQPKASREEALNYYRNVVQLKELELSLFSEVVDIQKSNELFIVEDIHGHQYETKKVVIATGYFELSRTLGITGEELPFVSHHYTEPYLYAHQKVTIIGGGNTATEAALDLMRHGVEVTMIVRKDTLKPTVKYWLQPDILNRIKEGKIKVFYEHQTVEIKRGEVIIKSLKDDCLRSIQSNFVLILTGHIPDTQFLNKVGVETSKDLIPVHNEETFETNVEGIYVAGTVIAGEYTEKVYIENGRLHAQPIVKDILTKLKNG